MPAQGISQGTAILVGKKLGEHKNGEAASIAKRGLLICGIFISIGMGLVMIYGKYVIMFFVNDPEVIAHGVQMFRITSASVVFFALYTVVMGVFQGGGMTRPIMVMNIVRLWGLRVPLSYLLPLVLGLGSSGIWWAMLISNFLVLLWSLYLFGKGSWKVTLDLGT